jgi:ribose transport system substrate-binding protein
MKSPTESNVPNYPRGISRRNLIKRGLIAGIALSPASRLFAASDDQNGSNVQLSNLAYSVDTLSSPSQAQQVKGGQAFAQTVGLDLNTLLSSGNTEREIADVNAVLSKFNGKVALMIDPLDSPDARPVVEACAKAGAYVVTIWNKTEDLHPWDFDGHYVAHISFDGSTLASPLRNPCLPHWAARAGS